MQFGADPCSDVELTALLLALSQAGVWLCGSTNPIVMDVQIFRVDKFSLMKTSSSSGSEFGTKRLSFKSSHGSFPFADRILVF